jgi:hypothetical protein
MVVCGLGAIAVVVVGFVIWFSYFAARGQQRVRNPLVIFAIVLVTMIILYGIIMVPDVVLFIEYGWYPPAAIIDDFKKHQSDFVNMANDMQDLAKDYYDEDEITFWRPDIDSSETSLTLSSRSRTKVSLTYEQMKYLEGISETFANNHSFNRVIVTDSRVAFIAEGNIMAIVHSVSGERPTYILPGDNAEQVIVKELDTNWFLLVRK